MIWKIIRELREAAGATLAIRQYLEKLSSQIEMWRAESTAATKNLSDEMRASTAATQRLFDEAHTAVAEQLKRLASHDDVERLEAAQRSIAADVDELKRRIQAMVAEESPEAKYYKALNGVGILNYHNDEETGERWFLTRFLGWRPNAVVLDVGAHSGDYTRLARSLSPAATLYAFEPHPITFEKLSAAAAQVGAKALAFGLGARSRTEEIYDYVDNDGSQHASLYRDVIEHIHKKPATAHAIRIETLDATVADLGVEHVDLLKVDTEGHEYAVFQGSARCLAEKRIDVIQFEFNEMNAVSRTFFHDFMEILSDYRLFRLLPSGVIALDDYRPTFLEIFAFQNIVAVRRDLDASWLTGEAA